MRPNLSSVLPTVLLSALLSLPFAAWPAAAAAQEWNTVSLSAAQRSSHAQALQSFRERRFADAYVRFATLADAGHVPSAQLALLMSTHGPSLFGSDWAATPTQQRRWNALVINAARQRIDFVDNERGD